MTKRKILVADDEPEMTEELGQLLEAEGYQVIVALDGVEALERVYLEEPDLILLDIILPKIDGYQVCHVLKKSNNQKYNSIPIIFITAKGNLVGDKARTFSSADDYIIKPIRPGDLLPKIVQVIK